MADHECSDYDSSLYTSLLSDPRLLIILSISVIGTTGTNIASPALPGVASALSVTEAEVGLLITVYTLPAMIFVPLTGVMADMYGRRTVVLPSLVIFGIGGIALAAVDSFQMMLLLRAVQGMAVSGIMPLTVTLLGDLYSGTVGTAAQGLRVSANGVGGVIVPFVAGILAGLVWNYPFLLFGLAFIVFLLGYIFLPETTGGIESNDQVSIVETVRWYGQSLRAQLDERDTVVLLIGGFARDFPRYAVMTFVPLLTVQALGGTYSAAGAIISIRGLVSLGVSPTAGMLVNRLSRKGAIVGSMFVSSIGILAIASSPTLNWLAGAVGLYAVGDAVFSPVIKDTLTDSTTNKYRSGVVGGLQLIKYAAQTASPAAFGVVLAVSGFDVLFTCAAVITAMYGGAVLVLFDPR